MDCACSVEWQPIRPLTQGDLSDEVGIIRMCTPDKARIQDLQQHLGAIAQEVGALQKAEAVDKERGNGSTQARRTAGGAK